ncbi:hypothetical protein Ciccas_009149, partial [Cichlidogyrus casuarinus]
TGHQLQLTLVHATTCKRIQIPNCQTLAHCGISVIRNIFSKTFAEFELNNLALDLYIYSQAKNAFVPLSDTGCIENESILYSACPQAKDLTRDSEPTSKKPFLRHCEASSSSGIESSESSAINSSNEASVGSLGLGTESGHTTPRNKNEGANVVDPRMSSNLNGAVPTTAVVVVPCGTTPHVVSGSIRGQLPAGSISRAGQIYSTANQQQILAAIKNATGGHVPQGTFILKSSPAVGPGGAVVSTATQNGTIQLARLPSRPALLGEHEIGFVGTLLARE